VPERIINFIDKSVAVIIIINIAYILFFIRWKLYIKNIADEKSVVFPESNNMPHAIKRYIIAVTILDFTK
jgi:hypothetical protein